MKSLTLITAAMLISVNSIADTLDVCLQGCSFNSVRTAIDAAKIGDLIRVAQATYAETLIVNKNIILQGGYSGPPTWQRDVKKYPTILDAEGTGRVIYVPSGFSPVIDGFTITGGKARCGGGIDIHESSPTISHNIIRNNQATHQGGGIHIKERPAHPTFDSNQIIDNITQDDGGGIFIDDWSSPVLFNNIIAKNKANTPISDGAGIYIDYGATPRIVNNTLVSNDNDGIVIYADPPSPSPIILNNIIVDHTTGIRAIRGSIGPNSKLDFNNIWSKNNSTPYNGVPCGKYDWYDDPRFVNPDSGDYHLQSNSPLIEKGTSEGAPSKDIDGLPRPLNTRVDIGADETAFIKEPPTVPSLVAPANGDTGVTTKPLFRWNASSGEGVITYQLQIQRRRPFSAWDSCFSSAWSRSGITEPKFQYPADLLNGSVYFWRVNTSNEYGTSDWSTIWSFMTDTTTAVSERSEEVPLGFRLKQNYPNPFNPSTTIKYSLPKAVFVKLTILDPLGKEIETLVSKSQTAGEYTILWSPNTLSGGVYLYRIRADQYVETRKMILLR